MAAMEQTETPAGPAQLAAQIERTRDDLAQTLDVLVDRVSPKRVAQRGTAAAVDKVKGTASTVKGAVTGLGGSPHGSSLSEPGADRGTSRTTLAIEVGVGALVAVLGLVLLSRRRR
jgi:hypothetical protein